ncbi:putative glutamine amidotransferase-like protein [Pseudolycoriella hygida]|uniref:Glutamine amidotransferase-like protein n=1 Tax=Pseudolycoriella hygida TaxID=35572 RepID=A0A9Q0N6Z2_9DIPT|nr:putative glutamine amidotransferase-like protein [Pseudolycoriella hygida]
MQQKKKPIIGISLDSVDKSTKYVYSAFPWYALRQNYAESVLKAGGIPLMLPYQYDTIDEMLAVIDGVIISGGDEDIHPNYYDQEFTSDRTATNDRRDNFEILLTKKTLDKNIPFLGICRGMQLLNVVLGGTLIQHIPDYVKDSSINHEQPVNKDMVSHPLMIKPSTILSELADNRETYMVNSTHHQAVDRLGKGLKVTALAPDGIIEAIESFNHTFVLGVEWHPEYLNLNGLDFNIFKGLIAAAGGSNSNYKK